MKDVAILMACWKSPELLKISVPSVLASIKTDSELIVILNEPDQESVDYLRSVKVKVIWNAQNDGPSAVDYAIPYIKEVGFKYVANINSDMIFSNGWDGELIKLLEANAPCTVSCCLVENIVNGHSITENRFPDFKSLDYHRIFNESVLKGEYKTTVSVSYNHPILCTTEDFLAVNGYSNNMEKIWVELKGRGLDDDFVYRLYKRNPKTLFLKSDKAFVYHGISLNSVKLTHRMSGRDAFLAKHGIAIEQFRRMINYPH